MINGMVFLAFTIAVFGTLACFARETASADTEAEVETAETVGVPDPRRCAGSSNGWRTPDADRSGGVVVSLEEWRSGAYRHRGPGTQPSPSLGAAHQRT